ncbi:uncharacterized protein IUM83_18148 [Phytophthora cinnamomi]|uniref:uncharacterized protein n=1 Tax=Phytophthora cinnamomi TaxID=4785 RepID=UPI00355A63B3|nr:hypothetical protein IUM83_18148 [Phytophthora cinnamomi]
MNVAPPRKNDFELFRIIKERARTQHKYHVLNMEYKQKVEKNRDKKPSTRESKPRKEREQRRGRDSEKPKTDMPPKRHDCPTASEDDRRRALEKLRSQREETKQQPKTARSDLRRSPKTGEVLVNGMVVAPYCADSGSYRSVIPNSLVDELEELGCDAKLSALPDPVMVTVAGGSHITCTMEAEVNLQLQTAVGMVRVSSVACLVMGGGETEFLLGDDTLKSLGIDVHQQLEQLAGGDVVVDDDPFEPEPPAAATSVVARLEDMMNDVLRERFDPDFHGELRQLVHEYQDIFAIDVGDEPPALVEPLTVTLKPDAVLFRAKSRKYVPAQRAFLRQELDRLETLGYIRKNNHSRWACAVVAVVKRGAKWTSE